MNKSDLLTNLITTIGVDRINEVRERVELCYYRPFSTCSTNGVSYLRKGRANSCRAVCLDSIIIPELKWHLCHLMFPKDNPDAE